MAKENGVRWYGYVLRKDGGYVLRKALEFEVKGNEEARATNEDVEDANGGEQECRFGGGGCLE